MDKANQALKAAVDDLMAQEEIRGLIIGEPSFAGLVGLSNTVYVTRQLYDAAAEAVGGTLCLDTQVKQHFDRAGVRAPVQTRQGYAAGQRNPGGRDLKWTAALCVVHKAPVRCQRLCFCPCAIFFTTSRRLRSAGDTAAADCRRGRPAR